MNYEEAKEILDQVKAGQGDSISSATIRIALWVTGDARAPETIGGKRMDTQVSAQDWRSRCRERAIMVARSKE